MNDPRPSHNSLREYILKQEHLKRDDALDKTSELNPNRQKDRDASTQVMGNVLGGVKDSYFVSKLLTWYWKRFKQFFFGKLFS